MAQGLGCATKRIQRVLRRSGGLGNQRIGRRARKLSLDELEAIGIGLAMGQSLRTIARHLSRAPSTFSREVLRNGARHSYRAWRADARAASLARRPKLEKLRRNPRLRAEIEKRLKQRWSSEQNANRLRLDFPDDPGMWISHETLYRSVYLPRKHGLGRSLAVYLRSGRTRRRSPRRRVGEGRLKGRLTRAFSLLPSIQNSLRRWRSTRRGPNPIATPCVNWPSECTSLGDHGTASTISRPPGFTPWPLRTGSRLPGTTRSLTETSV